MKLTVGIATWNRADLLGQTIEGLTRVQVPEDVQWEILVCDNNSTDHTRQVVQAQAATGKIPLRYLLETRQGQGHAHNKIICEMTGEWLLILDDDVQADPQWLVSYVTAIHQYPKAGCLAGQVLPWLTFKPGGISQYLLDTFPWVNAVLRLDKDEPVTRQGHHFPHGPNMAFRADLLRERSFDGDKGMKGKQRGLGEDTDYVMSVLDRGHEAWMIAANKVAHYIPRDRAGFRWFCQWNKASGRLMLIHQGPAPAGAGGLRLWHYKLIARLLVLAMGRRVAGRRRQAYETLAQACAQWGYLQASRATVKNQDK